MKNYKSKKIFKIINIIKIVKNAPKHINFAFIIGSKLKAKFLVNWIVKA